jgi:hypothetical protein
MERVGRQRRGTQGRIKARRPKLAGELVWSFHIVPATRWEADLPSENL